MSGPRGANAAETKLLANIERYERAKADADEATAVLRPLISEARSTIKDLRQAQTQASAAVELITECADAEVSDVLKAACDRAMVDLNTETRAAIEGARDRVQQSFDELVALLMTGKRNGKSDFNIAEYVEQQAARLHGTPPTGGTSE